MNNYETTTAYSTGSINEFKMEVISLMKKIKGRIDATASLVKINYGRPSKELATKLSVLKIHEFKLKEILKWMEEIDEAEWMENKTDLIKDYEAAYDVFDPQVVK